MKTYQELINTKTALKAEISDLESEIKSNKLVKLSSSIKDVGSVKDSVFETVSTLKLKDILASPLGNLVSSYLISNKSIRKYFIGFTILRQTVPYALEKLKDVLNEVDSSKKN